MSTQGGIFATHKAAEVGSTVEVYTRGFNALIVWHEIEGAADGGYVALELRTEQGQQGALKHPATDQDSTFGIGIKDSDTKDSYIAIYRGLSEYVGVELNVTDGKHTVKVQPINL